MAGQEHGWPFVYMVRASRGSGGFTIMYPMWPLGDPPLVSFRPTLLFLNVLCGVLLVVLAAIVPAYWLRVRQRPLQFSLRTLFVLTTVVACLLALLKCCYPDRVEVGSAVGLAIVFLFSLVYVVPACMVLTAAHWLVIRSASSARRFRWFGLHWLTWLAVCAIGGPFLHYLIVTINYYYEGYGRPSESYVEDFRLAWRFHWPALVGGLAVWLTVLASTAFVVERWIRRVERRVFLQKRAFLFLPLVIAVMIWISNTDRSCEPDWCDYYSWLFGLAGMIYAIEVLAVRHWNAIPKISLFAGTVAGAPFWFALAPLQEPQLAAGLSLVAAAFAATVIDAGRRDLVHRDKGVIRFVHPAYGEHVAVLPMWALGIIGIGGGLALLYT